MLKSRLDQLENAQYLATIEKNYTDALEIVDALLHEDPDDVDALRLKGNILDLKSLDQKTENPASSSYEKYQEKARCCYAAILKISPNNTVAHIDLGDYWSRKEEYGKAVLYYNKAIELLNKGHFFCDREEELKEALISKAELLKEVGDSEGYDKCLQDLKKWLPNIDLSGI